MSSMSMSSLDNPLNDDDDEGEAFHKGRCNGNSKTDPGSEGVTSTIVLELGLQELFRNPNNTIEEKLAGDEAERLAVLRSRRRSNKYSQRQSVGDKFQQRSNVPVSSTASNKSQRRDENQQFSRLKSTCHNALISFLNDYPTSWTNNNVQRNQIREKDDAASVVRRLGKVKSTNEVENVEKNNVNLLENSVKYFRNGCTKSSLLLSLYKFLKLILAVVFMFLKLILMLFILLFIFYCLMVLHKPTQDFVSRHTQDLIYPFMRTIRFGSLPFVGRFPQLHELYEDACVLANPFFEMNDVSCWPCESVRHVIDLTGFSNFTSGYYHSGIPFIIKDAFAKKIGIEDLYRLYEEDPKLAGNVILQSSHDETKTLKDLFSRHIKTGDAVPGRFHLTWKVNRVHYARQLRKYFSRPYYIPNSTEISVQHFLYIDGPMAEQYAFPVTEFANVFVMQADGQRLIVLVPVRHCRDACKAISVVLQPNDVLFYNWLFWRPVSFPMRTSTETNTLSITYVGSFY